MKIGTNVKAPQGNGTVVEELNDVCLVEYVKPVKGGHAGPPWNKHKEGHCRWVQTAALTVNYPAIRISANGYKTRATLYENGKAVKRASARCNPVDEFDFMAGARLALHRLGSDSAQECTGLSNDEKAVLRCIPKHFKWIARDKSSSDLWAFTEKPRKTRKEWDFEDGDCLFIPFSHIFLTIGSDECYLIEDLCFA